MTIVEFLTARLDEDEAAARAAMEGRDPHWWDKPEHGFVYAGHWIPVIGVATVTEPDSDGGTIEYRVGYDALEHIARHDPARVLAEVEAKRRIIVQAERWAEYVDATRESDAPHLRFDAVLVSLLGPLTLLFADHPDYDEAWRPTDA